MDGARATSMLLDEAVLRPGFLNSVSFLAFEGSSSQNKTSESPPVCCWCSALGTVEESGCLSFSTSGVALLVSRDDDAFLTGRDGK